MIGPFRIDVHDKQIDLLIDIRVKPRITVLGLQHDSSRRLVPYGNENPVKPGYACFADLLGVTACSRLTRRG